MPLVCGGWGAAVGPQQSTGCSPSPPVCLLPPGSGAPRSSALGKPLVSAPAAVGTHAHACPCSLPPGRPRMPCPIAPVDGEVAKLPSCRAVSRSVGRSGRFPAAALQRLPALPSRRVAPTPGSAAGPRQPLRRGVAQAHPSLSRREGRPQVPEDANLGRSCGVWLGGRSRRHHLKARRGGGGGGRGVFFSFLPPLPVL